MAFEHLRARLTRRHTLRTGAHALAALTGTALLSSCSEEVDAQPLRQDAAGSAGASAGGGSSGPKKELPKSVAGIAVPDSALAQAAATLLFEAAPDQLYNHCMRTYVFASLLFDAMGKTYDRELAFVGAALHDLGLIEQFMSPSERFELDGADAALKFLQEHDVAPERAQIVWDAIALHTNVTIAVRKAPEIAMVSLGAVMDAAGLNLDQLEPADIEAVVAGYPRLGFKAAAVQTMLSLCKKKPLAQMLHPFAEVGRRHLPDFMCPTMEDLMLAAPFSE